MRKTTVLLTIALAGLLAWIAVEPDKVPDDVPKAGRPMRTDRAVGDPTTVALFGGTTSQAPSPIELTVPPAAIGTTATTTAPTIANTTAPELRDPDAPRPMIIPVAGIDRSAVRDTFDETRGNRRHEAIDIMAPRGTPVIATDDGVVKKLFTSVPGGLTVYQFDPDQRFCYYYAHLDHYAAGLHEGELLHRGEVLGYVGTTGNAPKDAPHLHFALIRLDPDHRWWKGTYVNPYPLLR